MSGNYTTFPYVRSESGYGFGRGSSGGSSNFEIGSLPGCVYLDDYSRNLWADDVTCFVSIIPFIPIKSLTELTSTDPCFADGAYPHVGFLGVWGLSKSTGLWVLLASEAINPPAYALGSPAITQYSWTHKFASAIDLTPYYQLAIALDPLYAWTVNIPDTSYQYVQQYDVNPNNAGDYTANYLGVHAIGTAFTTIPTIKGGIPLIDGRNCIGKWINLGGVK
jgi:hypothetical protein